MSDRLKTEQSGMTLLLKYLNSAAWYEPHQHRWMPPMFLAMETKWPARQQRDWI